MTAYLTLSQLLSIFISFLFFVSVFLSFCLSVTFLPSIVLRLLLVIWLEALGSRPDRCLSHSE
jgi:hypothetical protein